MALTANGIAFGISSLCVTALLFYRLRARRSWPRDFFLVRRYNTGDAACRVPF